MRGQFKRELLVAASLLVPALLAVPGTAEAQAVAGPPAPASAAAPNPTPSPSPTPTASGPLQPMRGNIRTFWGDLRSFRGNIRTFWGDIRTFWGDPTQFGNANNPFDQSNTLNFWGNLSIYNTPATAAAPAWSAVGDFWTNNGTALNTVGDSWNGLGTYDVNSAAGYADVAQQLQKLLNGSAATWGTAVTAATGKSFNDGFVAPLLSKFNIDLSNPQSLQGIDPGQFLFAYYDGLMSYAGRAHVDHWMKEADYAPSMTQQIGNGASSTIGVLDTAISKDLTNRLTSFNPSSTFTTGHGDAVASLLVADPAKLGVMGMAPMAQVITYNPFDQTGTAGWTDVGVGVYALSKAGAGVVNASLGMPGWTLNEGWNQVFSNPVVASATRNTIFVIAAGNDGVAQTQNIAWNFQTNPNFIVVGSTNTAGTISSFSNMPGTACLTSVANGATCAPGNRLMDHFITAPGEMILVSDGNGGLTRMSGTSFAAPLVSGTIALLDDRWPWLTNYPAETVSIILQTARPMSDGSKPTPGSNANPTYGVGELDVGAALSPIDFNKVQFYAYKNGLITAVPTSQLRDPKQQAKWTTPGGAFYVFENIGKTYRDFAIPTDSSLINQTTMTVNGSIEQFQYYILGRLQSWMGTGTAAQSPGKSKFAGVEFSDPVVNGLGLAMSMAIAPKMPLAGYRQSGVPYQTAIRFSDPKSRFALTMGAGDGALVMSDRASYGSASDYDPYTGGSNPVLGFASGGAYGEVRAALTDHLSVSTGFSQRDLLRDTRDLTLAQQEAMRNVRAYGAQASKVAVSYDFGRASVTGSYTHLHENDAILGQQSTNPFDIAQGSGTDGATLETSYQVTPTLSLDATGTVSHTTADGSQNFRTAQGLRGTSWQLGISKNRIFGRFDAVRVTVAQPLHVEDGRFDYTYVKVVDRQTGELGPAVQMLDVATSQRLFVGEAAYSRSMMDGAAQFRLFGRANLTDAHDEQLPSLMAGAGFRLAL